MTSPQPGNSPKSWPEKTRHTKWWKIISRTVKRWGEADCDQHAASFAWFFLMSLLPLVTLLAVIASFFVEQEAATREVVRLLNEYTPLDEEQRASTEATVQQLLKQRGGINTIALGMLAWGSLKFLRTLIKTSNHIWQSPAYDWWKLPLKSIRLLLITVSAVLIGVLLPGVVRLIRHWFSAYFDLPEWVYVGLFRFIPWLVLFYGIVMIFKLAPSRVTKLSEVWLGALLSTGLIWIGQSLFVVYVLNFASFNVVYGTLGGMAMFFVWIYYSCSVCIFGLCLCASKTEILSGPSRSRDNLA